MPWRSLQMTDCLFCKFLAYRRIPFRQPDDLRCFGLKIKRNLTPFAVVVHLIQVDSGGDFLFAFGLGFAFQANYVKHSGFCQQTAVKLAPEKVRAFLDAILTRTRQTRQHDQPSRRKSQDMEL